MKKTAMITGAMGGIGFAAVKQLLSDGYCVSAFDLVPVESAQTKLNGLEDVIYTCGDLTNKSDRDAFLKNTLDKFGRVDALVNVAGVAPKVRNDLLEMTEESYDFVMNVNTKSTMFLTQAVAKEMIKRPLEGKLKGYIVNISSMSAYTSSISRGEYCISKAGVSMLTTLYADRLAEEKIIVNEIRPGIIATGMTSTVQKKYDDLIDGGLLPIKRWGQPEDIARVIGVLCSENFGYTTGQSIDVDGGFHIQRL